MTKEQALPFVAAVVFGIVSFLLHTIAKLNETGKFPRFFEIFFLSPIKEGKRAIIILRIFSVGLLFIGFFLLFWT